MAPMPPRLRIVSVNDVYSLEHLPRLATLVRHHATHDPADLMLVVVAGDFLAPSVLSSLDAGRGMVDCLNHLPLTHAVLGNHEDDVDPQQLRDRLRELRCKVLLTNVSGLDDTLPKTDIVDVAGVRVGLLGVTAADPKLYGGVPFGGAHIADANETTIQVAAALVAEGCACVVPITHQSIAFDRDLAASAARFPLILGGHEHDGLREKLDDTWLVKAHAEATTAVVADILFEEGSFPAVSVRLEPVASYAEDAAMRARVDRHLAQVRELEAATILILGPGESLSSVGTRKTQTTLGEMICSRLRDTLQADAAIFNGGGIRGARRYTRRLTYGDIENEVPFENEIVVVRLSGAVIRDAVAASRAKAPAESGGFLQVDDRIIVDGANRVTHIGGEPLEPARVYRVALPRELFGGLDHIEPLVRFAEHYPEAIPPPTTGRDIKVALASAFAEILWKQLGGFRSVDHDADGVVTHDEIVEAIARTGGMAPSPMAAKVVLEALDRNEDGTLTRDERKDEH